MNQDKRCDFPYSDEFMTWEPMFNYYRLTEAALIKCGINIRKRIGVDPSADVQSIIDQVLNRTSELVYGYIHDFTLNTMAQDMAIAKVPSLRPIIYKALTQQAVYFMRKGDISHSLDERERELCVDMSAKQTLASFVPEIGTSILYAGGH